MNHLLIFDDEDTVALFANETSLVGQLARFGLQHSLQVVLPLLVKMQPNDVEIAQDLFHRVVLFQTAVGIEQHHRCSRHCRLQLEQSVQTLDKKTCSIKNPQRIKKSIVISDE